jgi:hypothetical protein
MGICVSHPMTATIPGSSVAAGDFTDSSREKSSAILEGAIASVALRHGSPGMGT